MAPATEINRPFGSCDLCGLPLPHGTFRSISQEKTFHFCCMGCRQVFTMLMEASDIADPVSFKESELFRRCQELGIVPGSQEALQGPAPPQGLRTSDQIRENESASMADLAEVGEEVKIGLDLKVHRMWCPSCAWVIEEALSRTPGVTQCTCNFSTDRFHCLYNPVLTSPSQIIRSIETLGYRAFIPGQVAAKERKREFIRFAISAFLTMNVMMLSFGLYSGFFTQLSQDTIHNLSWPAFIMASVVLFYGGKGIYTKAWAGLRTAAFSMETLITVGAFSAYLYSTANLIFGSIHLYYDTASMLISLVLLGKTFERRAKGRVQQGLENFFSLRPAKVRICSEKNPGGRYLAASHLRKGDVFRVEEGEIVAADGLLLGGRGFTDESSLTGEPKPLLKRAGDRVKSGSRLIQGTFKVKAEGVGEKSTLGQMIMIMEQAIGKRTPLEGKTDLALRWFVPAVLSLAAATALICLVSGFAPDEAVLRAVTVMVIACPCTLGIAIPLARVAAISMAGEKGILIRDFSSFEKAERVDAFVFDKTGTVTTGKWALQEIVPFEPYTKREVLAMAASLERESDHHIATEIKRLAQEDQAPPRNIDRLNIFQNGISGILGGQEVKIGSRGFLGKEFANLGPIPSGDSPGHGPNCSFVFMAFGGKPCAIFVFGDRIKKGAPGTVGRLQGAGYRVLLVSGDEEESTKAMGQELGIGEAYGGKLPRDKASFIRGLQKEGHGVAMVGDGINDAPALVQADLALAVYSEDHLVKEAGDLTLMRGAPEQILVFLQLARRVNKKAVQNLICSFLYNVVSIPIAMSGLLTPLIAVCAMLMSSLSVIGNTFLLTRKAL